MRTAVARPRGRLGGWWPDLLFAAFLLVFPFAFPLIGGSLDTAQRILVWGLFGLGFDLLFGFTGLLSFGQAAFFGVGGFTAAYFLTVPYTTNALVALVVGTVTAAAFGVIIGLMSLRRAGIYFAMLTLAFGEMFYFLEISPLSHWTGGENGIAGVPTPHLALGPWSLDIKSPAEMYWFFAVLMFLGFWLAHRIIRSPFGAVLRAIRENHDRVPALGHDVLKYKLAIFVIAAAYAGLAGVLLGIMQGYMPPDAFYLDTSGQLVIQTVIGGAGTLIGPLVGAAVWLYLYTALQLVPGVGALWKMILGIIFVLLVTLLRRGICGGLLMLWQHLTGRSPGAAEAEAEVTAETGEALPVHDEPVRTRPALDGPVILEAKNLVKRYGGLVAVDGASLQILEGEIHALIGPNGAGKTTFFNMLAGWIPATEGDIFFRGERITTLGATLVCQRGVAKSFQINQLFPSLTVRENLLVPVIARHYGSFRPAMLRNVARAPALNAAVEETLAAVQLSARAATRVAELAYGEKRRLEIGLALATRPQILLLDEPMAGMSPSERTDTVRLLKRIAAGITIVIVEHDMDVVFELADRITVLYNGRKIAEGTPEAIQVDPQVRAAYLGSAAQHEPA
jgi:branched-chain amino acid transport system permease protein